MPAPYLHPAVARVLAALKQGHPFLHILIGPRQVGKSTAANDVIKRWKAPAHFAAADTAIPPGPEWVKAQWEIARGLARKGSAGSLLVLDEIQKVHGWSETVKGLWDEERRTDGNVRVILLGSSSLLMQQGLTESLAGRFLLYRCPHWGYPEMREAFGFTLDQWLYFGGYPGAAVLANDETLWRQYVADALVETALARDVLQMHTVAKPALLRHLFGLAAGYPAQIFSYNKMLGQLQDAGNTTTLAHYLRLLQTAFLVSGLDLRRSTPMKRGSSPKLILWNNALISAVRGRTYAEVMEQDPTFRGRVVENAVGAHLLNHLGADAVGYWRDGNDEIDFTVTTARGMWGLEVKSGKPVNPRGMEKFLKQFPQAKPLVVGSGGMALEDFFATPPGELFG